ncbi:hypothetical protein FQZ97_1080910 [compost metagenome]
MGVGVGHQFVRTFGGRIERDRLVDGILDGEGHLGIHAVDRAAGGVDQVANAVLPAAFQHVDETSQVDVGVDMGILQRVAHASLSREVDHALELMLAEQ